MKILNSDNLVWTFLAAALLVQATFVYCVANSLIPDNYYNMGRFYILFILALGFAVLSKGPGGILDIVRPMLVWKVSPWWYLYAIFWLIAFAVLVLFIKNVFEGNAFKEIPLTFGVLGNFGLMKGIFSVAFIEEMVWIGFVLTLLRKKFTWFVASQILAVFWYLWWMPAILYGRAVIPDLPLPILWFHYMGIAATCAWVYYFTKSGLIVALMQMLTNTVSLIVPVLPHLSDMQTYVIFIVGKFLLAATLFFIFGPKPLFRKGNSG
ncbi:MAG: hypothetical protein COB93_08985 [Sneathiella sp.]|nr:MAG: hypothetical protein COB93_08985 [Sneathiella sp.]